MAFPPNLLREAGLLGCEYMAEIVKGEGVITLSRVTSWHDGEALDQTKQTSMIGGEDAGTK